MASAAWLVWNHECQDAVYDRAQRETQGKQVHLAVLSGQGKRLVERHDNHRAGGKADEERMECRGKVGRKKPEYGADWLGQRGYQSGTEQEPSLLACDGGNGHDELLRHVVQRDREGHEETEGRGGEIGIGHRKSFRKIVQHEPERHQVGGREALSLDRPSLFNQMAVRNEDMKQADERCSCGNRNPGVQAPVALNDWGMSSWIEISSMRPAENPIPVVIALMSLPSQIASAVPATVVRPESKASARIVVAVPNGMRDGQNDDVCRVPMPINRYRICWPIFRSQPQTRWALHSKEYSNDPEKRVRGCDLSPPGRWASRVQACRSGVLACLCGHADRRLQ